MKNETPPPHEEPRLPLPDAPSLTARQKELFAELSALDPQLAGLYCHGLRLLADVDGPGTAHLLAHAGRELSLGVVDALLDEGWSLNEKELAEIPDDEKHRAKIARSLGLRPADPRVSEWFKLHSSFSRAAHYRRGAGRPPDPDELRLNFERLEHLLYGRVGPYFQIQAELDELLGVPEPDESHVERLQAALLRPQQRRYFFEKANAAWLRPLDRSDAFSRPRERRVYPDDSWQAVAWPEGRFLSRVARDEPDRVLEILERLPHDIENPSVWRVVADVANQVPPESGRRLATKLAKAAGNAYPVIFANELTKLITRLADAGHAEAFDVAAALLAVANADDMGEISSYRFRSDWLFPRLRWTQFSTIIEQALPALERVDGERALNLLLGKLNQIAAVAQKLELTHLLSSRLQSHDNPDPDDLAHQIVQATSQLLARFASQGSKNARRALEMVQQYEGAVFTSLRYVVIGAVGQWLQDELDAEISSNAAVEPDDQGRGIALILREQFGNASTSAREMFRYAIERGPDPESVRDLLYFRGNETPTPEDIVEAKKEWQRERFVWFRGQIPAELRELAEELGVWGKTPSVQQQELAKVGFCVGGVTYGEPRPFTQEDLGELSADEIVELTRTWHPDDGSSYAATKRGFEQCLQELAAQDPIKALEIREAADDALPLGFAQSLLAGLRDAVTKQVPVELDWHRALSFVQCAVQRASDSEDLAVLAQRALLRSAIDLIEEGTRHDLIPAELEAEVWECLSAAIRNPLTWDEQAETFESFEGLYTAALNRAGPRTVRAALLAALWSYRLRENNDIQETGHVAEEYLAPLLDEVLKQSGLDRRTAEAIIGRFLPQLQLVAPEWVTGHLEELLGDGATAPFDHPTWGAYVMRARLYDDVFETLRPWYVNAAEDAAAHGRRTTSGNHHWSLTSKLAEHVLIAVLRGLAVVGDSDGLVEKTFTNVSIADRGLAFRSVFQPLSNIVEQLPDDTVDRVLSFWEWRLDELETAEGRQEATDEAEGLGWLIRSPHLPDAEVLRLGLRTTRAAEGKLELQIGWDRLGNLAATDVDEAFAIAELILTAQLAERHHYIRVDEVKPLLSTALECGNEETQARARRLVNKLGEAGYDDFRELLE